MLWALLKERRRRKRAAELDLEVCTVIKEGMETKVTCLVLPLSRAQEKTKTLQQMAGGKERGARKRSTSSFSPCLASFCSPLWSYISWRRCMKFTLSEKPNTAAGHRVRARFVECIIKLEREAKLSPPARQPPHPRWGRTWPFWFQLLYFTLTSFFIFSPALCDRVYMHVICVDRNLQRDLHPPAAPQWSGSARLFQGLTWHGVVLPSTQTLSSPFKGGLNSSSHSTLTYPCIWSKQSPPKKIHFLIWKSSSGRFERHKDERVGFKICPPPQTWRTAWGVWE